MGSACCVGETEVPLCLLFQCSHPPSSILVIAPSLSFVPSPSLSPALSSLPCYHHPPSLSFCSLQCTTSVVSWSCPDVVYCNSDTPRTCFIFYFRPSSFFLPS